MNYIIYTEKSFTNKTFKNDAEAAAHGKADKTVVKVVCSKGTKTVYERAAQQ